MQDTLRRAAILAGVALPLLAGCAGSSCEYLVYEQPPREGEPLVMPAGVPAPVDTGAYRVPPAAGAAPGTCPVLPPMTLPEEALQEPDEAEAGAETEGDAA